MIGTPSAPFFLSLKSEGWLSGTKADCEVGRMRYYICDCPSLQSMPQTQALILYHNSSL